MLRRTLLLLLLSLLAAVESGAQAPPSAAASPSCPPATAARLCQLLVQDADGQLRSMAAFANGDTQLFADYVLFHDGWRDVRIFPHRGQWYAATAALPATLSGEHQRYIHEVFPRMLREAAAGHWQLVDQYIDRLLQYQRRFAAQPSEPDTPPADATPVRSSAATLRPLLLALLFLLFLAVPCLRRWSLNKH